MPLVSLEAALATVRVPAVSIAALTGDLNSRSSWAVLAGVALFPLIVMKWLRPSSSAVAGAVVIMAVSTAATQ